MRIHRLTLVAAALLAVSLPRFAAADAEGEQLAAIIEKHAPAICNIRTNLKSSMKGEAAASQDTPMNLQGVVVTPDGLVMVSNFVFAPNRMMELMGAGRGQMPDMKYTPTAIKVSFAGEDKEYDAFLAATDTNMDLAFIQLEGLEGRKLPAIDFSAAGAIEAGQKIAAVARLAKGYDYAPFFQTGRISGRLTKPRRAYMIEGQISNLGMPVFALSGEPVGVLSTVAAGGSDDAAAAGASYTMFMRMMTGGGGNGFTFILPATTVKGVIDQAAKRAGELAVERANKRKAGKPVEDQPKAEAKPEAKPGTKPAPKPPVPGKKP
jgi:S1-C subfamily serine protease